MAAFFGRQLQRYNVQQMGQHAQTSGIRTSTMEQKKKSRQIHQRKLWHKYWDIWEWK